MFVLKKKDGTPIVKFEGYEEVGRHIRDQENSKLLEDHPEFGKKTMWSFTVHLPETVAGLSESLEKRYDPEILSRALQERSGIIEMCLGDEENPHLVIASPGVDVEGFRKEFYGDYFHAHNMFLTEGD